MKPTNLHNSVLYQNLGKLYYAIAAADKTVDDKEFIALQNIIKQQYTEHENKETLSILETFEWLRTDNEYSANKCYDNFVNYKRANEEIFSNKLRSQILQTASKITASFAGQNKSELIMLAKLDMELKRKTE